MNNLPLRRLSRWTESTINWKNPRSHHDKQAWVCIVSRKTRLYAIVRTESFHATTVQKVREYSAASLFSWATEMIKHYLETSETNMFLVSDTPHMSAVHCPQAMRPQTKWFDHQWWNRVPLCLIYREHKAFTNPVLYCQKVATKPTQARQQGLVTHLPGGHQFESVQCSQLLREPHKNCG